MQASAYCTSLAGDVMFQSRLTSVRYVNVPRPTLSRVRLLPSRCVLMVTATAVMAGSVLLRNRGESGRLRGCLRSSPQRCQGRSARHAHSRVSGTSCSLDWNFERLREDYPDGHCESGAVIVPEE
jgi:hypothetical protein